MAMRMQPVYRSSLLQIVDGLLLAGTSMSPRERNQSAQTLPRVVSIDAPLTSTSACTEMVRGQALRPLASFLPSARESLECESSGPEEWLPPPPPAVGVRENETGVRVSGKCEFIYAHGVLGFSWAAIVDGPYLISGPRGAPADE